MPEGQPEQQFRKLNNFKYREQRTKTAGGYLLYSIGVLNLVKQLNILKLDFFFNTQKSSQLKTQHCYCIKNIFVANNKKAKCQWLKHKKKRKKRFTDLSQSKDAPSASYLYSKQTEEGKQENLCNFSQLGIKTLPEASYRIHFHTTSYI